MNAPPIATYRIQLREGVDFADVEQRIPYLADLGISHIYLSPIFTATKGSTHGYDIIDPTEIDPILGGRGAFESLATAAHSAGLGIVLDIVPNHIAFSLENPWLREVLIEGPSSRYAFYFDIDWQGGPLVLPILPDPFEKMLAQGRLAVEGDSFVFDEIHVPLGTGTGLDGRGERALRRLHETQFWRLRHWEAERDSITHRRFFNVTGLIGMRVEDPKVFDDTHAQIIDLVRSGHVDALRVDHIDGLADPKAYLDRLDKALPGTPVWVEKILVGGETLRQDWKTVGSTGYEAARLVARILTPAAGLKQLDTYWRGLTDATDGFEHALHAAKCDILSNELAAELHKLIALAHKATRHSAIAEPGPEALREALIALLSAAPRYRTYIDSDGADAADTAIIERMAEHAKSGLRSGIAVDGIAATFLEPHTEARQALATRFQQTSGALLAKSQEDTAGFRWARYLAANEVGAEPEEATAPQDEVNAFLRQRTSWAMSTTSTHDTKRSEDSRMRLVAISHDPGAFVALFELAMELPTASAVEAKWQWYIVQSALAIWDDAASDLGERLSSHVVKAMREAKEATFWTHPDTRVETAATDFATSLIAAWRERRPIELERLVAIGDGLTFAQLIFKSIMPGFPDFYRGSEAMFFALTDPDNRRSVNWLALEELRGGEGLSSEKARLTHLLLRLRGSDPAFFAKANSEFALNEDGFTLRRFLDDRSLIASFGTTSQNDAETLWWQDFAGHKLSLGWARRAALGPD